MKAVRWSCLDLCAVTAVEAIASSLLLFDRPFARPLLPFVRCRLVIVADVSGQSHEVAET